MSVLLVSHVKMVVEIDHNLTGIRVCADRKNRGLSYRVVAARMNISANYLSDLEKGRRNWSEFLVKRYENAVQSINCEAKNQIMKKAKAECDRIEP